MAQGLLAAAAAAAMAVAVAAMALLRPAARPTYLVDWYSFRPPDRRGRLIDIPCMCPCGRPKFIIQLSLPSTERKLGAASPGHDC